MFQIKILALNKPTVISLTTFATLLAIALAAPLLHHQLITGIIVNAVLFWAAFTLGWPSAITIGVLPSLIALLAGTLPLPLLPMIPFIIAANAILALVFFSLKKKSYFLAAISAGFLKFVFLFSASSVLVSIFRVPLAKPVAQMMSLPQLITALLGALAAYVIISFTTKKVAF
ncbi:MAG: iron hydrogenase [Patescibacteria group bacterium]|nr:iron hydrogenase [Patescibacteria group bacterium]